MLLATSALSRARDSLRRVARLVPVALVACSFHIEPAFAELSVTSLISSKESTVFGESLTLTARVMASGRVPTGTVKITDATRNVLLGSLPLDADGYASVAVSTLAVGNHALIAEYSGDANLDPSASPFLDHVVRKADTTIVFAAPFDPTNPCGTGQTLLFNATVSAAAPGSGVPTGTVRFWTNGFSLFSAQLSDGRVVIPTNGLGPGVHNLTATYDGDARFNGSASAAVRRVISNGPRLSVNSFKPGSQQASSVTALNGGGYVVVWQSVEQDGSGNGIYGQLFDPLGSRIHREFRVNTRTASSQVSPSVAGLADGGFVVTWQSEHQDGSGYGIYGQRFNAAGVPTTAAGSPSKLGEFAINTTTKEDQTNPSVAALHDGGFAVVWMSELLSDHVIVVRRFRANGVASPEIKVATTHQDGFGFSGPSVAGLANGGFVVAWQSEPTLGTQSVNVRRFNPNNEPAGAVITADTAAWTSRGMSSPHVYGMSDGGFVLTWNNFFAAPTDNPHSFAQRYGATGMPVGSRIKVNTTGGSYAPAATPLGDGGFVVVWRTYTPNKKLLCPGLEGIYGQRFNKLALKLGKEFIVAGPRSTYATQPAVAGLKNGGFVVTWSDDEQEYYPNFMGIYRRQYPN